MSVSTPSFSLWARHLGHHGGDRVLLRVGADRPMFARQLTSDCARARVQHSHSWPHSVAYNFAITTHHYHTMNNQIVTGTNGEAAQQKQLCGKDNTEKTDTEKTDTKKTDTRNTDTKKPLLAKLLKSNFENMLIPVCLTNKASILAEKEAASRNKNIKVIMSENVSNFGSLLCLQSDFLPCRIHGRPTLLQGLFFPLRTPETLFHH